MEPTKLGLRVWHSGPIVAKNDTLEVRDCTVCGFAHLKHLPTQDEVTAYYTEDKFYATHSPPDWWVKNRDEHVAGLWNAAYDRQIKLLTHDLLCSSYPDVLDIGCGDGYWLQRYAEHGGWVIGIEPSDSARLQSLMVRYIFATIQEYKNSTFFMHEEFGSVRMALVLEHVLRPYEFLVQYDDFIGPNGRIMVIVPNEFNTLQKRVAKRVGYDWYVQKPHINYFSKSSINLVLQRCGYRVVQQTGTFPMELLYLMGYKYIGNDAIGQMCHRFRLNFETKYGRLAFKLYDWWYKWWGWGRETIIVGERYNNWRTSN